MSDRLASTYRSWRRARPGRRIGPVPSGAALRLLALLALACAAAVPDRGLADDAAASVQWQALDVPAWTSATTGFRGASQRDLPLVDKAYDGGPIQLGGRTFDHGLGLYPYAEVTYLLDGRYDRLQATVGARPRAWTAAGGARVLLYGDSALLYDSGPLLADASPRELAAALAGVQELRVVAVSLPNVDPAYAYFASPLLLPAPVRRPAQAPPPPERAWAPLAAQGTARAAAVRRWQAAQGGPGAVRVGPGEDGAWILAASQVAVVWQMAGASRGSLVVLDLAHDRLVGAALQPAVVLADGAVQRLGSLLPNPAAVAVRETTVPALGSGQVVRVPFGTPAQGPVVGLEVSVFPDRSAVLLQLDADRPVQGFRLLDGEAGGGLALGEQVGYVTDFSRPREGRVRDDGLERPELVSQGAPVFLWSAQPEAGVVLAPLDEADRPARFGVRREPTSPLVRVTLETGVLAQDANGQAPRSPRLYLEPTATSDPRQALGSFRALSAALYPPPPLPPWLRHQWGSWYVYGMDVDEWKIREYVDYLADNLSDVGPWHILLDAGWFVAEGRPGAEPGRVDADKFPSGLRALIDYAHARGVRVILYYAAPYVDTGPALSKWLALPGLITQHPDWLIPLGATAEHRSFVYDFAKPGLRAYMQDLLRRYLLDWQADGLTLDMLGHTEGAALNLAPPDRDGLVRAARAQSLAIYRFVAQEVGRLRPDVFVEGAWDTPPVARPYAHTWRYGDDYPVFRSPYPLGGLVEHVDYAVLQHLLLGQRPHLGAVTGPPDADVNFWWLGAGLALGAEVVLSLPLTTAAPTQLAKYRAYLVQAQPFTGETRLGPGLHPDTFATTVRGTTFLGVLNRERAERDVPVDLAELGLSPDATYRAYDVAQDRTLAVQAAFTARLPGESFRLFVLRRDPGVLWTSSAVQPSVGPGCLALQLQGPPAVPGFLKALVPALRGVYLDGRLLAESDFGPEGYRYDADLGLLDLRYGHRDRPRELRGDCATPGAPAVAD